LSKTFIHCQYSFDNLSIQQFVLGHIREILTFITLFTYLLNLKSFQCFLIECTIIRIRNNEKPDFSQLFYALARKAVEVGRRSKIIRIMKNSNEVFIQLYQSFPSKHSKTVMKSQMAAQTNNSNEDLFNYINHSQVFIRKR
jgi:hypothetical protein